MTQLIKKLMIAVIVSILIGGVVGFQMWKKYQSQSPIQAYGKLVTVGGRKMNIYQIGKGKQTLVFIPGQGEPAPKASFTNLAKQLKNKYRLVFVEPLGSGLSDDTPKLRTSKNIVSEIHEALQKAGIKKGYFLAGHSIGGIYGLQYVKTYGSDVKGFIGIDSSTPGMEGGDEG